MLRILIAEDEEPIANLIRINLTRAGYQCTWAPDGQTAADLMEREKFDLALLDIMLPGINGLSYSKFMYGLKLANVDLNRKVLSEMAVNDAEGFAKLAELAKSKVA